MAKKFYVIDTSVYITDFNSIFSYSNNDIIVPLIVLEELDKLKKRPNGVGVNARSIIRILDSLRNKGQFQKGIRLRKGAGLISTKAPDLNELPNGYDPEVPDHQIIATALTVKRENPEKKVIVISNDINLRIKCDAIGIPAEAYATENVIEKGNELYSGFTKVLVDEQIVDRFYAGEDIILSEVLDEKVELYHNQFVMLVSSSNDKKTAITRYLGELTPLKKIPDYKGEGWGITPKNKEQNFAMDLLYDENVPVISLIGKAGSGKTLCAIAAGLEQVMGQDPKYNRLIVSRPIQPMGKDIGYLPGTMEEKMAPWMKPIFDNMQYIMGTDKTMLEAYLQKGLIEIEALAYIRGRSISDAFVIIDEAQNLTAHEVKTIITRIGENTKIVLTGDIEQIDNVYTNETSNGLTYAIEKLKGSHLSGHVTFKKGERSKLATEASKLL